MRATPARTGKGNQRLTGLIGGEYLFTKKGLDFFKISREWVKFTGSKVYRVEQYYYPISDLLQKYLNDFAKHGISQGYKLMGLFLSKRILSYLTENNLDTSVLVDLEASYIYKFKNLFITNIVRYLNAHKDKLTPDGKHFRSDITLRARNILWRVIATTDSLIFNPNYKRSYPNYKKELDFEREQESLHHLRNHMKYDIDYLLSKKTLLSNFEPVKKFLWENITAKDFKYRLFSYMFLFEYHWILAVPNQKFGKFHHSNFKHFPEFKVIQELYSTSQKFRKEYSEFSLIANNLLYVGYEDFAEDLK